ncbi:hypothetical protein PAESOLCIP111_06088 [Paenibacillus solanacearum]|uniref:Uncharacterized protein n=1 Tax=Paenibacillus solanacearum TaxID=2048548 RepID=A0A916KA63_9BACL|nr:hypothetical protein PAESOLCIP111_06088 [Paenibacillus solanacearum]
MIMLQIKVLATKPKKYLHLHNKSKYDKFLIPVVVVLNNEASEARDVLLSLQELIQSAEDNHTCITKVNVIYFFTWSLLL